MAKTKAKTVKTGSDRLFSMATILLAVVFVILLMVFLNNVRRERYSYITEPDSILYNLKRGEYTDALEDVTMESFMGEENPLPDTYIVSLTDLSLFQQTLDEISAIDGVEEASYDANTAETLTKVRQVVLGVGGAIIIVLLVVSLFIIVNTIKLTVYHRRLEIYIMKSVGATDGFVRFPFIVEGILLGITAGGAGYGLVYALYTAMVKNFDFGNPMLSLLPFSAEWLPLLLGFLVGGVLIGVVGSAISMGKYLKQEGSERI